MHVGYARLLRMSLDEKETAKITSLCILFFFLFFLKKIDCEEPSSSTSLHANLSGAFGLLKSFAS